MIGVDANAQARVTRNTERYEYRLTVKNDYQRPVE
jgi:hypothetical protein